MSLFENVKKACAEKKVSIMSVETKCNFPRSSICKWDVHRPSIDKVKAVADLLDVSIDSLVD